MGHIVNRLTGEEDSIWCDEERPDWITCPDASETWSLRRGRWRGETEWWWWLVTAKEAEGLRPLKTVPRPRFEPTHAVAGALQPIATHIVRPRLQSSFVRTSSLWSTRAEKWVVFIAYLSVLCTMQCTTTGILGLWTFVRPNDDRRVLASTSSGAVCLHLCTFERRSSVDRKYHAL